MHIFFTGGTGFIGSAVVRALVARGHDCTILTRSERPVHPGITYLRGDPRLPGAWQDAAAGADAVVNLAGAPFVDPLHPWTEARKALLRASRVDMTRLVAAAIRGAARPPRVLVSASAIGYYGDRGDEKLTESTPPGDDFLANLVVDWESAAYEAESATRVVTIRTGLVLGRGGLLRPMLPFFKLGLGGVWGDGRQWWPWIHLADEVGLVLHALDHDVSGPINLTAPNPARVETFAKALGRALGRPVLLRAPAFLLRLGLGEAAAALLVSQRVLPQRAIESGYDFRFTDLDDALSEVVSRETNVRGTQSAEHGKRTGNDP